MKYAVIILPPAVALLALVWGGESLLERSDPVEALAEPAPEASRDDAQAAPAPPSTPPVASVVAAAPAAAPEEDDAPPALVPADLVTPLRAVAPDVSLCIPAVLERDKGPLDVAVHFTPTPGGAFASGTEVETSWDDDEHTVSRCIAEVFDEATFWPSPPVRFARADFVFHFPDDAMRGLLGMRYSPFE